MHSREWIFWVGHLAPDELGPLDNLGNILGLLRRKNLAGIGPSEVGVEDAEVSAGHEGGQGIQDVFGDRPVLGVHCLSDVCQP
ncbi:hypothetical protein D3C72_1341170 [compost metagenome]